MAVTTNTMPSTGADNQLISGGPWRRAGQIGTTYFVFLSSIKIDYKVGSGGTWTQINQPTYTNAPDSSVVTVATNPNVNYGYMLFTPIAAGGIEIWKITLDGSGIPVLTKVTTAPSPGWTGTIDYPTAALDDNGHLHVMSTNITPATEYACLRANGTWGTMVDIPTHTAQGYVGLYYYGGKLFIWTPNTTASGGSGVVVYIISYSVAADGSLSGYLLEYTTTITFFGGYVVNLVGDPAVEMFLVGANAPVGTPTAINVVRRNSSGVWAQETTTTITMFNGNDWQSAVAYGLGKLYVSYSDASGNVQVMRRDGANTYTNMGSYAAAKHPVALNQSVTNARITFFAAQSATPFNVVELTQTLNTTPTAPTALGTSNLDGQPRLSWTFNDPDAGDTQSAFQVTIDRWTGSAWVLHKDSGKVLSANKFYDILSADRLAATTQYRFKVKAYDAADAVSPDSAYFSWTTAKPYYASGALVSPVFNLGRAYGANGTLSWVAVTTADHTLTADLRTSADNVTWSAWTAITNGGTISPANYIQVRFNLGTTYTMSTPELQSFTLSFPAPYVATGSWLSPVIDGRAIEAATTAVSWTATLNGGTVVVEARHKLDTADVWSAWQVVAASGNVFPTLDYQYQLRATLNAAAGQTATPQLSLLRAQITANRRRGIWTSQTVDVSQATDKTTGKATSDISLLGDVVATKYRYSTDGGATWSAWTDTLSDGTMTTPTNTTHVKIRHVIIGSTGEVKSTTLFFDGTPAATSLITGLSANADYDFTQLRDMVIICNGKDAPRKWDKTNAPTTLGGSPPAFQMIETHLNRAWGAGDPANPSRVRFSDILNPEAWPALNFIDFNPEDGDRISAIFRYGQQLVVSKKNNLALLTGDRSTNFAVAWLDHDAGAEGFRGMQIVDKYLAYVARDGIRFSDLTKSIRATERLAPSWEQVNHRRLNQGSIITLGNYMLCSLPSVGSLVNDQVWFFDQLRAAWSIIPNWKVSSWLKFRQYGEEILLGGDSEQGQVYQVFTGNTDVDGTFMAYDYQTKDFDAGAPERYKVVRDCILIVGGKAEQTTLDVRFIVDGVEHPVTAADTVVPAGDGVVHSIRLIPPIYGAVLGQRVSLRIQGRAHIHAVALGLVVRGVVPGVS